MRDDLLKMQRLYVILKHFLLQTDLDWIYLDLKARYLFIQRILSEAFV